MNVHECYYMFKFDACIVCDVHVRVTTISHRYLHYLIHLTLYLLHINLS